MLIGHIFSFVESLFKSFAYFFIGPSVFLVDCKRSLYIFWEQALFQIPACKYFLLLCGLPCHFLNYVFQRAKVFNFKEIHFINIFFYGSCFLCPKKSLSNPRS